MNCLIRFIAVVEGRARLLHHDPGVSSSRSPWLLSHPGDLVGWAGLVRRHPCEWLTASTDLKLIGIPAEAFYRLERESDAFRVWLDRSSTPSEFIQVWDPVCVVVPTPSPTTERLCGACCLTCRCAAFAKAADS